MGFFDTRHKFYISTDGVSIDREVFPLEVSKIKFSYERLLDSGQRFFRVKMTGKLTFVNKPNEGVTDFSYFNAFQGNESLRCRQLYLFVHKYCSESNSFPLYWTGVFSTGNGTFDLDKCKFEIKPNTFDRYTCLLTALDQKVNLLDVEDRVTTSTIILPDYEYHFCRSSTLTFPQLTAACAASRPLPIASWRLLHTDDNGEDKIVIYFRERVVSNCVNGVATPPAGSGWLIESDNCAVDNTAVWVRLPIGTFAYPNPDILPGACSGSSGTVALPPPPVLKADVTMENPVNRPEIWGWQEYRYYDNAPLKSIIQYTFKALNGHPTSVYTWDLPSGGTIISGQGTDTLVIEINAAEGDIDIECVETTACGDSNTSTYTMFERSASLFPPPPDPTPIQMMGPRYVCLGEEITLTVPDAVSVGLSTSNVIFDWGTNQGDWELVAGGGVSDNFLTLKALTSGYNLPITCAINLGGPQSSNPNGFIYAVATMQVSKHPRTEFDIFPSSVCSSETGLVYSVYNRTGATYEWTVTGGSIVSGQGSNSIVVDWGVGSAGEVAVKETSSCGCTWIEIAPCGPSGEPPYFWCDATGLLIYSQNIYLQDAVQYLVNQSGCAGYNNVVSDIFEWNPVGDTPGYAPGINYINGDPNEYNLLTIAQKSDIVNPFASNPATIGEMTLRQMNETLREMFNVWWYIDDSGNVRYEHWSAFTAVSGLNLTLAIYSKFTEGRNKYEGKGEDTPAFERFQFMESRNRDFVGAEIRYESFCVNKTDEGKNVVDHQATLITTDLQYIDQNPDEISAEGFVILANYLTGASLQVITDIGILSGQSLPNMPLSWASLQDVFYRHGRYQKIGFMNNIQTIFDSILPTVKQADIEIQLCCEIFDFNPENFIQTELGETYFGSIKGLVNKAEFTPTSNVLKLTLEYPY